MSEAVLQGKLAEAVDLPWHAAGRAENQFVGRFVENAVFRFSSDFEPMIDIADGIIEIEIIKMISQKYALIKLTKTLYFFAQLRLPDKKDGEKVFFATGEIREIFHFVERGIIHLLRLIEEKHEVTFLFIAQMLELGAEKTHKRKFIATAGKFPLSVRRSVRVLRRNTANDIEQEIRKRVIGIFKIDYFELALRKRIEEHVSGERLAGTDFSGEKTYIHVAIVDNIKHSVERFAMTFALEEKPGIACLFKGFFA
jgi:hypothetical protein